MRASRALVSISLDSQNSDRTVLCPYYAGIMSARCVVTRVQLDLALAAKFFASIREADFDLDGAIAALQSAQGKWPNS